MIHKHIRNPNKLSKKTTTLSTLPFRSIPIQLLNLTQLLTIIKRIKNYSNLDVADTLDVHARGSNLGRFLLEKGDPITFKKILG